MYDIRLHSRIIKSMNESFLPHIPTIRSITQQKLLMAVEEKGGLDSSLLFEKGKTALALRGESSGRYFLETRSGV